MEDFAAMIANARADGWPDDVIADLEEEWIYRQDPSYVTWEELHELEDDGLNGRQPVYAGWEVDGRKFQIRNPIICAKGKRGITKKLLKKIVSLRSVEAFFEFTSSLLSLCVREETHGYLVPLSPHELNPIWDKGVSRIHAELLRRLVLEFYEFDRTLDLKVSTHSTTEKAFLDALIDTTGVFENFMNEDVLHIAQVELVAILERFAQRLAALILENLEEPQPDYTLELDIKATAPPLIINPQIQPNAPTLAA
jgi:hypothetical protein